MDQILEKWDEILMTVKTEHDISDIAFNTFLRPLEFYGVTRDLQADISSDFYFPHL